MKTLWANHRPEVMQTIYLACLRYGASKEADRYLQRELRKFIKSLRRDRLPEQGSAYRCGKGGGKYKLPSTAYEDRLIAHIDKQRLAEREKRRLRSPSLRDRQEIMKYNNSSKAERVYIANNSRTIRRVLDSQRPSA